MAHAATDTWNNASAGGAWSTGPWNSNSPVNGDSLLFSATGSGSVNNDLGTVVVDGITFDGSSGSFTLAGSGIHLGFQATGTGATAGTSGSGDIVSSSSSAEIISMPITLDMGKHAVTTGTASLALSGTITRSAGTTVAFTDGGGGINLSGSAIG